jgi:large subunit ribosomal protein L29
VPSVKANDLRKLSPEQLQAQLDDDCRMLFRIRFQAATEKLDRPSEVKRLRREIARIKTLLGEREREMAK